jgi:hypothetical protein
MTNKDGSYLNLPDGKGKAQDAVSVKSDSAEAEAIAARINRMKSTQV